MNERHLRWVLAEFADHYNTERPHRSLGLEPPLPRAPTKCGPIRTQPVPGGLRHVYRRAV